MKRLMVTTGFVVLLLSTKSHAQSGAVIPQGDAGQASQTGCVILKRMGRIDRTKSRLYSLGISGKQFRFVEGKLPEGFSSHHKMTDHDVRNLQARGAQVLVLDSHYTPEDLKEARAKCPEQTGQTPTQVEAKASPAPAPATIPSTPPPGSKPLTGKPPDSKASAPRAEDSASARTAETAVSTPTLPKVPTPKAASPKASAPKADGFASSPGTAEPAVSAPTPVPKPPTAKAPTPKEDHSASPPGTTVAALLDVSSSPTEADIYVDERLSGRTPLTLILMPGDHKIVIKKSGFLVWKRKLSLGSGRSNVDAALLPRAK